MVFTSRARFVSCRKKFEGFGRNDAAEVRQLIESKLRSVLFFSLLRLALSLGLPIVATEWAEEISSSPYRVRVCTEKSAARVLTCQSILRLGSFVFFSPTCSSSYGGSLSCPKPQCGALSILVGCQSTEGLRGGGGFLHLCLLGGKSRPTMKRNESTSGGSPSRIGGRVACRKEPKISSTRFSQRTFHLCSSCDEGWIQRILRRNRRGLHHQLTT